MTRAIDLLAAKGRRRLAAITPSLMLHDQVVQLARARGMHVEPYWLQAVPFSQPQPTQNIVHLLMHPGQAVRPDALFVTDDNLAEYAVAGLVQAGVRVGVDADVVAHCNFPWPTPSAVPVTRLGFDAREVLKACIDAIDAQRQGEGPTETTVYPIFEHEVRKHF